MTHIAALAITAALASACAPQILRTAQQSATTNDEPPVPSLLRASSLNATVIRVDRSGEEVLAEIDAGFRHGLRKGDRLALHRGGDFVASLTLTEMDVSRARGVVSLEHRTLLAKPGDGAAFDVSESTAPLASVSPSCLGSWERTKYPSMRLVLAADRSFILAVDYSTFNARQEGTYHIVGDHISFKGTIGEHIAKIVVQDDVLILHEANGNRLRFVRATIE